MEFDKEQLEKLSIYALRNIAREIGVKAPTTLTKQTIIEEILQIESGKKQPCAQSKRGRPGKYCFENKGDEILLGLREKAVKKQIIDSILKEIERKLYEIL